MQRAIQGEFLPPSRPELTVFRAAPTHAGIARWTINGFPAMIIVWTQDEWENLTVRPCDAQYFACGVWCALRIA